MVDEVLQQNNYFIWEFSTRVKLMKIGLLDHLDGLKTPNSEDSAAEMWKVNDMKAFAVVASSISPNLQSMARGANTAAEVWETLHYFLLQNSVHNRIQNRRKLHEFKMQKGGNIMEHFCEFDEVCMALQASERQSLLMTN
uniref:AlNc14C182G8236 protein n=1 Tax=Albugo laibachii Nc14 TaxID=890382 RepID=F0WP88_9STRA|nr:AlNc14C182G8236 [Albugo laibachii Nc14]|eukprot:CCA23134.1 AlNc14C182G8236 [Albugo laibachii Nc14]